MPDNIVDLVALRKDRELKKTALIAKAIALWIAESPDERTTALALAVSALAVKDKLDDKAE